MVAPRSGHRRLSLPAAWPLGCVPAGALADVTGATLEGAGVAENVAFEVVPNALFLPIVYGLPTGLALVTIRRSFL